MPALDEFLRPFHIHFARSEATHALEGRPAGIWAKMNSVVDPQIIDALYAAAGRP